VFKSIEPIGIYSGAMEEAKDFIVGGGDRSPAIGIDWDMEMDPPLAAVAKVRITIAYAA
jgi:hypothetical protein